MSKTDLKTKTKAELLKLADRLGLRGISTMNKPELVETISRAKQRRSIPLKKQAVALAQKAANAIKRRAVRKRNTLPPLSKTKRKASPRKAIPTPPPVVADLAAHKFDVAPAKRQPKQVFLEENLGELPDSYGTGRLFLSARDLHWLFAYWDFHWQQLAEFRKQASDGRVVLRVFEKNHAYPAQEITLGHDSRNWYIPAHKAATTYHAELGYWRPDGAFNVISRSREATTPSAGVSADTTARFATLPVDVRFNELLGLIRQHVTGGEKLAETLHRLQSTGYQFPFRVEVELGPWTREQTAQLQHIINGDILRKTQVGSLEMTEWLRRRLLEETSSGMFSGFSPAGASWSGQPQQGFWFAVNAELVIYGATEPDAKVTIDGQPIKLRSDGTFSFHYAFPDGQYRLPVVAVSGKHGEKRSADLRFERKTKTSGDVGQVRAPAHLKAPTA
ncbi:MAG: hypothetical protein PCFJNLEI_03310 [Verrucomicrobiae bacterium]|nr:hypothetical protein [Verrucomicrobiae bacterium]